MNRRLTRCHRLPAVAPLAAALGLVSMAIAVGCSGEDEAAQDSIVVQQPSVDPRFATAQGLVDQFNALTTREPIDIPAVNALYYAENPRQQALCTLNDIMVPLVPLNNAMQERFKQPIDPSTPTAFVAKANGPAKITQEQGERVTATYKEWDGRTETLQLVKYNQRWWISGYTMEHHPNVKNVTDDDLRFMTIVFRGMAAVAPSLIQRIKSGEFRTVDDARRAIISQAGQEAAKDASNVATMREIAQRNPKYAAMFSAAAAGQRP